MHKIYIGFIDLFLLCLWHDVEIIAPLYPELDVGAAAGTAAGTAADLHPNNALFMNADQGQLAKGASPRGGGSSHGDYGP